MKNSGSDICKRRSDWSEALRAAYLALLRETGNARASARRLGHPTLFQGRKARDPVFRRECLEAVAEADARLRLASGAFPATDPFLPVDDSWTGPPPPIEIKSMPSDDEPRKTRDPVIRRTSNGRLQISYVRDSDMSSADEAAFLALLRETGQFEASALAIGFSKSALYRRVRNWPDFARRCDKARDEADVELEYRLVGQAHALMRRPEEARLEGEAEVPFDPEAAIRILRFLDRRRAGRHGGRPRKGPPERSFDEAVESILAKVEAIERHREMRKEKEEKEGDDG